jgi:mono/diheme cytochrome c family protein
METGEVSNAPADPALASQGAALVSQKACLGCHVIGEAGGGAVGPSLNGVIERKGPAFVRRKLRDPTFNNETSMMPNLGLTPEQVEALTAYLATQT